MHKFKIIKIFSIVATIAIGTAFSNLTFAMEDNFNSNEINTALMNTQHSSITSTPISTTPTENLNELFTETQSLIRLYDDMVSKLEKHLLTIEYNEITLNKLNNIFKNGPKSGLDSYFLCLLSSSPEIMCNMSNTNNTSDVEDEFIKNQKLVNLYKIAHATYNDGQKLIENELYYDIKNLINEIKSQKKLLIKNEQTLKSEINKMNSINSPVVLESQQTLNNKIEEKINQFKKSTKETAKKILYREIEIEIRGITDPCYKWIEYLFNKENENEINIKTLTDTLIENFKSHIDYIGKIVQSSKSNVEPKILDQLLEHKSIVDNYLKGKQFEQYIKEFQQFSLKESNNNSNKKAKNKDNCIKIVTKIMCDLKDFEEDLTKLLFESNLIDKIKI